ncbi:MAG: hypothetical protein HUU35_08265 [Armatimonadetes bacterium]|nr:hypothetical protein [Armatimonadota bacterium]
MVDSDEARRVYWREQMEQAARFMETIAGWPVAECGEPLASLPQAAAAAGVEVVFSERPHVLGLPRLYYLRSGLIAGFVAVAREMNQRGWVLRVEDGFRTLAMQQHQARGPHTFDVVLAKLRWECGGDPSPELLARRLGALVAASPKVGTHMSGSAIDIAVLDRTSGDEIDRGGPYVDLSERTPMNSPFVSAAARANRQAITAVFARHGFVTYPWEFWHYSAGDAYAECLGGTGRPARYGAVHAELPSGAVTPIEAPEQPLNTLEDIARQLRERVGA